MKTLTAATIIAAIEAGARSLSAVYKAHGGTGNVSGSTTKKIRGLVPDVADRIKAAKAGKPYGKQPKASDKAKLFRNGSLIGVVFALGQGKPRPLADVIDEAAKSPEFTKLRDKSGKKLGIAKRRQRARWQYTMVASQKHPTNRGRVRSVETDLEGKPRGNRKLKDDQKLVRFEAIA